MYDIESNIECKKKWGKYLFYIALFVFFFIPYKNVSDILKPFILSYFITDIFIILFKTFLKYLGELQDYLNTVTNYIIYTVVGIDVLYLFGVRIFFLNSLIKKPEEIIFSFLFFLLLGIVFLVPHIKRKPLRISKFDFEKKMMLVSYVVYTIILVIIPKCFNLKIFNTEIKYLEYQLIVCVVYLDRLKDMYSLGLICGTKEDIEKFEKIVENNKTKINYDDNKKLIADWKRYLAEDNPELENTIKELSSINKKFFTEEIIKLNEKVDNLLSGNNFNITKKQKRTLKTIRKRKIEKREVLVLEFLLYKTDIEEIIGETDD